MTNKDIAIKTENLKKIYKLGEYNYGTFRDEFNAKIAKLLGKENPSIKIGHVISDEKGEFYALNGIDLTIYKGETIGIIGHNGAGKSTLLKLISRVTNPTEGTIGINGRISSLLEVGAGFNREMTGRENIYLNGAILGMKVSEINEKIDEIIEFSECSKFIDTPLKRYSSGMFVKLAFSVAAFLNNDILIMDEVLAVGDIQFQKKCLDKMWQLSRESGKTVLYVSHNMSTIRQLCKRCIVLNKGKIVYDGTTDKAIAYYSDNFTQIASEIDLKELPRNYKKGNTNVALLTKLVVSDRKMPVYSYGDKITLVLSWESSIVLDYLEVRIRLQNFDTTPIGTYSFALHDNNTSKMCHNTKLILDSSFLSAGEYLTSIEIWNENVDEVNPIDRTENCFSFEIINDSLNPKKIFKTWNRSTNGSFYVEEEIEKYDNE